MRLEGKVALITGGASGMGKVASELFAREGAAVVLTDVNDEAAEAAAPAIASERGTRRSVRARRRLEGGRRRGDGRARPSTDSDVSTSSTTTPA